MVYNMKFNELDEIFCALSNTVRLDSCGYRDVVGWIN